MGRDTVTGSGRLLRTVGGGGGEPAELTATTADDPHDREPAWSPDGTQVAFLSDTRDGVPITFVFVVPAEGGAPRHIGPDPQDFQECVPALHHTTRCGPRPTGEADQVAWLSGDELVYAATVQQDQDPADGNSHEAVHGLHRVGLDGAPPQLVAEVERPINQLVPSPDGRFVLYGQSGGTSFVMELASGESWTIDHHVGDRSWSPDGERLLYSSAADGWTEILDGGSDGGVAWLRWQP